VATMLARGEMLGGYRIEDLVGLGGMAIVYRAEQLSLGRTVALKVLAPQLSLDTAFRERFRREGTHAAALNHPHVVTVYDSGEADGRLYLAMRLVEGTTLGERMQGACRRRRRRRSWRRSRPHSTRRTRSAWSTATSSRTTSCSTPTAPRSWRTSGSRRARAAVRR